MRRAMGDEASAVVLEDGGVEGEAQSTFTENQSEAVPHRPKRAAIPKEQLGLNPSDGEVSRLQDPLPIRQRAL